MKPAEQTSPTRQIDHSVISGIRWPAMPGKIGATLLAIQYQLDQSQWWSPAALQLHQLQQIQLLLIHASKTVPFYQEQYSAMGFDPHIPLTAAVFEQLPLLTRSDIQTAGSSLLSSQIPSAHGKSYETQTSGSTGQPVKIHGTDLTALFWHAFTLRDHHWHKRQLRGKLAVIRAMQEGVAEPPEGHIMPGWGPSTDSLYQTGPLALLRLGSDVSVQASWLQQQNPAYLLTYPSNLMALISYFKATGAKLDNLMEVRTVGETLSPDIRAVCLEVFGVPIVDLYSSQEIGYIALQCPHSTHYHIQSENALVEILNAQNQPCSAGEIGRLVVTSLHNFATPLIRYELGDYAEAAPPCPCGRGLPVIRKIMGRHRNMLILPSGDMRWPLVGFRGYAQIAPIRQYQFIQHTLEHIEVRLVTDRSLIAEEETRLSKLIQESLGHPFQLTFTYLPEIPRQKNGKFEEFVSAVKT